MDYSFNVEAALRYGVNGAIFIQNLYFWIQKNEANERHFYDGKTWTYNSARALSKLFPFWSKRQIDCMIKRLVDVGAIFIGNYNKKALDRTRWFALSDDVLSIYAISPKCQMQMTNMSNANDQNVTAIPDSKPYSKQTDKDKGADVDLSGFSEAMQAELTKWLQYKKERRQPYTKTGLQSFMTRVQKNTVAFGEPAVVDLIELCMSNGWAGVIWDKLKPLSKTADTTRVITPENDFMLQHRKNQWGAGNGK